MRKIFILLYLSFIFSNLNACDICGCSSGNYFIGPVPQFSSHFAGIRYSYMGFFTVLHDNHDEFSKDQFQQAEIWGGIKIKKNIQAFVFIPYAFNMARTDEGTRNASGIGDISVLGNYKIFDKKYLDKDTNTVWQQIWVGGGVRLPTGKFDLDTSDMVSSASLQPGKGNAGFILMANYSLMNDNRGITATINYSINQPASGFRFGNQLNASVFAFKAFNTKNFVLSPNIGLLYENPASLHYNKETIESTGGRAFLGATGLECRINKFNAGINCQLPLASNLSEGQTKITWRAMTHLSYAF
jgi:hypothetical protein